MIQDITHRPHKSALFSTLDVFLPPKGLHQCLNYPWSSSLPLLLFPLWKKSEPLAGKDWHITCAVKSSFLSCGSTNRGWSFAIQPSSDNRVQTAFQILSWLQFLHVLFIIFLTCYVVTLPALWTVVWSTGNFLPFKLEHIYVVFTWASFAPLLTGLAKWITFSNAIWIRIICACIYTQSRIKEYLKDFL